MFHVAVQHAARDWFPCPGIRCLIFVDAARSVGAYPARMKKAFRIVPLSTEVAQEARRVAATGQPDHQVVVADSPNAFPCRHCLRWAAPGEAMILFPYQSIRADRPYAESGPIFVHQEPCEKYSEVDEYPAAFRKGRVVRGYNVA